LKCFAAPQIRLRRRFSWDARILEAVGPLGWEEQAGMPAIPEQNAFRQKRCFALPHCFGASLRFMVIPSNRKTLWSFGRLQT
jgi:hypothetical protein